MLFLGVNGWWPFLPERLSSFSLKLSIGVPNISYKAIPFIFSQPSSLKYYSLLFLLCFSPQQYFHLTLSNIICLSTQNISPIKAEASSVLSSFVRPNKISFVQWQSMGCSMTSINYHWMTDSMSSYWLVNSHPNWWRRKEEASVLSTMHMTAITSQNELSRGSFPTSLDSQKLPNTGSIRIIQFNPRDCMFLSEEPPTRDYRQDHLLL